MQTLAKARKIALCLLLTASVSACGTEGYEGLKVSAEERATELAAHPEEPVNAGDLVLLLFAAATPDPMEGPAGWVTVQAPDAGQQGEPPPDRSATREVSTRQGLRASTSPDPAPEIDPGRAASPSEDTTDDGQSGCSGTRLGCPKPQPGVRPAPVQVASSARPVSTSTAR